MSPRPIQPPTRETVKAIGGNGDAIRETHPAFGVATVHRSSNTPGAVLFQSDLQHRETITLTVYEADRTRDLSHDWTHPGKVLCEFEVSLAQWGALISSQGIGAGVPVTIRRRETEWNVPGIPYESRLAVSIEEVRGEAADLIERANRTLADLQEAVKSGRIGAIKEALRAHEGSIRHVESNSEFYVKSMADAAEKVVATARADIEAHIMQATRLTGATSIEAPDAPALGIEP